MTKDVWPQEASSCTHKDLIYCSNIQANAFKMYLRKTFRDKDSLSVESEEMGLLTPL